MIRLRIGAVDVTLETPVEAAEMVRSLRDMGVLREATVREQPITATCVDCGLLLDSNKKHRCQTCNRERKRQQNAEYNKKRNFYTKQCEGCGEALDDYRRTRCPKCTQPKLVVTSAGSTT